MGTLTHTESQPRETHWSVVVCIPCLTTNSYWRVEGFYGCRPDKSRGCSTRGHSPHLNTHRTTKMPPTSNLSKIYFLEANPSASEPCQA